MSNELPEWYIEWVTRVSNVVSFKFPFKGTDAEVRYLSWLADDVKPKYRRWFAIDPDEYMEEAQVVWTFVHLQMEKYALWKRTQKSKPLYKKHLPEIEGGLKLIDKLKEKYPDVKWMPEQVVRDKDDRYQGTIDLIRIDEENKTVYLYDWKTFWIAKKKWKLPNKYKRPTEKLKKLNLQLSLYAETYRQKWYKIGGIYWVYLHETGCYEYELDLYSTKDINQILKEYNLSLSDLPDSTKEIINNITNMSFDLPMTIEILEPTKTYGNVKIGLDLSKVDNGKTAQENVDELCKKARYIATKMKD